MTLKLFQPEYKTPIKNYFVDPLVSAETQEAMRRERRRWWQDHYTGWYYHPDHPYVGVRAILIYVMLGSVAAILVSSGLVSGGVCAGGTGCIHVDSGGLEVNADDSVTVPGP